MTGKCVDLRRWLARVARRFDDNPAADVLGVMVPFVLLFITLTLGDGQ